MVECVVEILGFEFPRVENHSIVFDLFTPWVNQYRILPGHGHMNRILPTWKEDEYFKFLAGKPATCPIVIEARNSRAGLDQLKRHTTGMEKFCGVGQMDIYQSLVDLDEEKIVQDVVFKDLTGKVAVGSARIMIHTTFWPDVKEKFMSADQRPLSPAVQTLVSSLEGAHKPLSPRDAAAAAAVVAEGATGRWHMPPVYNYEHDHDGIDHIDSNTTTTTTTTTVKATLFDESPNSPLTFRKQQTFSRDIHGDELSP